MSDNALKHRLIIGSVQPVDVKGNIKGLNQILGCVDTETSKDLIRMGFWEKAPFDYLNGVIRWGRKDDFRPDYYGRIKRNGALEFSIMEVEFEPLRWAEQASVEAKIRQAVTTCVCYIAKKYDLHVDFPDINLELES